MANELYKELELVTNLLLDDTRPAFSLRGPTLQLKSIFEKASGMFVRPDEDIGKGETLTQAGVAISSTMASMCVEDFARTVQFIRGLRAAVCDVQIQTGGRPVRVLYAGCGPWATIATPIMSIFSKGEVQFILVDIHRTSIECVQQTIQMIGLTDRVSEFVVGDVLEYHVAEKEPPDIIIIEMLRSALRDEPQVAVSRHLYQQAPTAVLIPSEVKIDLVLVNMSREFSFDGAKVERDRIHVDTVFKFNQNSIAADDLRSTVISIPEFDESRYRPMLMTSVRTYADFLLADYDSGITIPTALQVEGGANAGDKICFQYQIAQRPGLRATREN